MEHQSTLFPAAGTAEGLSTVPISTLPPEAGISFEVWKKIDRQAKQRAYHAALYREKREEILKRNAEYRAANRERAQARGAAYYAANREKVAARIAEYRAENKEKMAKQKAAYRAANKERIARRNIKYNALNRAERTKKAMERRKTDPLYRLTLNLRRRLGLAFKAQAVRKTRSTLDLTGCTKEELRQHLVSQFREGMTLENHGKVWHIDHVRPCGSFDLSDPNQAILCFHYSNLQPLFADENLRKSDKWVPTETRPLAA